MNEIDPQHRVKRYSGGRLYDATTQSYVTAGELRGLWREGAKITVEDAETGEDITATVIGEPA